MKTLHLLRHAKSDWSDTSLTDHDRPLNKRGKRARKQVAAHVADWNVDLIVCSTAKRARQTAKPVIAALGCRVEYEPLIYLASFEDLFKVVRALAGADERVMLVGHNPSIEEFTERLCGWTPDYPTAALGTVALSVEEWSEVALGCGTLTEFTVARDTRPEGP
jgi:phosphohistidine phosphatase